MHPQTVYSILIDSDQNACMMLQGRLLWDSCKQSKQHLGHVTAAYVGAVLTARTDCCDSISIHNLANVQDKPDKQASHSHLNKACCDALRLGQAARTAVHIG